MGTNTPGLATVLGNQLILPAFAPFFCFSFSFFTHLFATVMDVN